MWQRFTERARRVIIVAQQVAIRAQSRDVDTEHLLVGLLEVDKGLCGLLLEKTEANLSAIQIEATSAANGYALISQGVDPKLAPNSKRVLELAAEESRRMRHNYIGLEHLLLALIGETRGQASQILQTQGVDLEKVRSVVAGLEEELAEVQSFTKPSQREIGDEQQLLSLLERRPDLLVEILGLDVLALKKARLALLVRLDMFEQAAVLRDEIENEHS